MNTQPFQPGNAVKLTRSAFGTRYPVGTVAFVTNCYWNNWHGWRVELKGFDFSDLNVQASDVERVS